MNFKFTNLSFTLMLAGSLIVSVAYAMKDEDDNRAPLPHRYGSEPSESSTGFSNQYGSESSMSSHNYGYGSEPFMGSHSYGYGSEPVRGYNYGSEPTKN